MSVTLTLDDFVFQDFEIPEDLPFGGAQTLAKKQLLGGQRQIDAMGPDDDPIEWSGRFRGPDATTRARALDTKRRAGKALTLTWDDFTFTVVIARFRPIYQRAGLEVPYSISLEVVDAPVADSGPDAHQMMLDDNATAQSLGDSIGDGQLSGLLGTLDSAVGAVSDFASATASTLAGVMAPIRAVQGRVSDLLDGAEGVLSGAAAVGGVMAALPIARMASGLVSQASAAGAGSLLFDLQSTVGRMAANIGAIGAGGALEVVAGGNLFDRASKAYGDAAEWGAIAAANGITDPMISGIRSLLVPPVAKGLDGVLGG